MIVLFTDFGPTGPYVGQMLAVVRRQAPQLPVVQLMCDAPAFNPLASAHLLAALSADFPQGTIFLAVVDPGVGSATRRPVAVYVDEKWLVGPDNGLFDVIASRGVGVRWFEITWRPERLSATFHGRDLFAPVAAALARGERGAIVELRDKEVSKCGDDLAQIVYVDHFGNAMTGMRARHLEDRHTVIVAGVPLPRARTYAEVARGQAFWYENSIGLAEIAVNQGSAARHLGLTVGSNVEVAMIPHGQG
jgi:S-adenosylmethionine hydrolase